MSETTIQSEICRLTNPCAVMPMAAGEELSWYAFRVYGGRSAMLLRDVEARGLESYVPMKVVEREVFGRKVVCRRPLIASLVFVRATRTAVEEIHKNTANGASVYRLPGVAEPAPSAESEMTLFRRVTEIGAENIEVVDIALAQGDRVRVTGGQFAGCEGYVARIKGAKRLIVAIEGVTAVATSYIPREFLKKVE